MQTYDLPLHLPCHCALNARSWPTVDLLGIVSATFSAHSTFQTIPATLLAYLRECQSRLLIPWSLRCAAYTSPTPFLLRLHLLHVPGGVYTLARSSAAPAYDAPRSYAAEEGRKGEGRKGGKEKRGGLGRGGGFNYVSK